MDIIIILGLIACGALAALGIFLLFAAFFKKGCGWLIGGLLSLLLSAVFLAGSPAYAVQAWLIGAIVGALLLAVVRYLETESD